MLFTSTDTLELILDKAVTTSQLSFSVSFNEYTGTTVTPTQNSGTSNSTTAVPLISAPTAGNQRQLRWASIFNSDTKPIGTKIRFNVSGSYRNVLYVYLAPSETIQYSEQMGWRIYDANGNEKVSGYNKLPPSIRMPEFFGAGATGNSVAVVNSGTWLCNYLGKAERVFSSVKLQYRVTTALSGGVVSYAEIGICRGTPTLSGVNGASGTLFTIIGTTNTSSIWNSLGSKTTTVTCTGMAVGDDLWAVFGNSTTGTGASLTCGIADALAGGFVQTYTGGGKAISLTGTFTGNVSNSSSQVWVAWQGVPQGT